MTDLQKIPPAEVAATTEAVSLAKASTDAVENDWQLRYRYDARGHIREDGTCLKCRRPESRHGMYWQHAGVDETTGHSVGWRECWSLDELEGLGQWLHDPDWVYRHRFIEGGPIARFFGTIKKWMGR